MTTTQKARVFDTFCGLDREFREGPILNMLGLCQKPRVFRDFRRAMGVTPCRFLLVIILR